VWQLSQGAQASALRYPAPKILKVAGIVNHVVDAPAYLLSDISLPKTLASGDAIPLAVRVQFLVCDDKLCVPQSVQLALNLRAGNGKPDPARMADFARALG
jgi:DsbC/DsbD-like thiol-disulfide interchange protein